MIAWLLLAAASSVSPAKAEPIGDGAYWINASDFPRRERSKARLTKYDLSIDAEGKPYRCTITSPSGSSVVDEIACKSMMKRATFTPAHDSEGKRLASIIQFRIVWEPRGNGPNEYHDGLPDLIVSTDQLDGKHGIQIVEIVEVLSHDGEVETCSVVKPAALNALNEQACSAVAISGKGTPALDGNGLAIRSVRNFSVGFTAGRNGS